MRSPPSISRFPLPFGCLASVASVSVAFAAWTPVISGQESAPPKAADSFLAEHCYECHDDVASKGELNLLDLPFRPHDPENFRRWVRVFDRVENGEMPPPKKARPEAEKLETFLAALEDPLVAAEQKRVLAEGRVKMRRLNRREYEQTMHDLLGIDLPLSELLPEEPRGQIFETTASAQQLSQHLLARYLDIAEIALREAFDRASKGEASYSKTFNFRKLGRGSWKGGNYRGPEDRTSRAVAWPIRLQFYGRMRATVVPASGWYRVTIKDLHSVNTDVIWGTLKSGACQSSAPVLFSIGNVEATREKRDVTYEAWIQKGHMLELKPADLTVPRAPVRPQGGSVSFKGVDLVAKGAQGIAFTGIEMTRIYPNAKRWEVRKHLFGGIKKETVEKAGEAELKKLVSQRVRQFANRAFRRPVTAEQSKPYAELALAVLEKDRGRPAEALFQAYRAILCSPRFLTFYEKPGQLDQHALACRISYLLWNSMPDPELRKLAGQGKLKGKIVHNQVNRMLDDPRSDRFVKSFTDQWLNLKEIDFTNPDTRLYPTFDPVVQDSMLAETRAFFAELIRKNHRIHNLIHSDFAMLNERLARFYWMKDLPLEKGGGLQKVKLGDNPRGGLITQGAILKVTADGTSTSPIVRGVYVSERILGVEIPPPPPGLPTVEPDVRGAVSIRDQLDKHRDQERCAACHRLIDPAGFALESFDPVGLWRKQYGRKPNSAKVDPSGVTPGGRSFADIGSWKQIYLKMPDQLSAAFARQVLTYATGAEPGFSDRAEVDKIVRQARAKNYGMRTLLHAVVASKPFQTK